MPSALRQPADYYATMKESKSSFWIIADATKKFYQDHGVLPVAGGLPDMKAQSNVYIQLQNLYKDKARRDAKEVLTTARSTPGGESVDAEEVELFCTNARFIKLINAPSETDKSLAQITGVFHREVREGTPSREAPALLTAMCHYYRSGTCQ